MLNDPESFLTRYCTTPPVSVFVGALMPPTLVRPSLFVPVPPVRLSFLLSVVSTALVTFGLVLSKVKFTAVVALVLFAASI